tara:strand:+ start:155 stop:484 length:330 start_codon:yes stop_codon:yes gene_type:complete
MQKEEKKVIKLKIKEEIKKTEFLIKDYKEMCKPIAPENAIGRVSRMDAINNKSVNEVALKKAEEKLKKLQQIEKNIKSDNFGQCINCTKSIPIARILIIPESNKCVNCA